MKELVLLDVEKTSEERLFENVWDALIAYLRPLEVHRLNRADLEANPAIRVAIRAMNSKDIPDRGDTRHEIVSAVSEQFSGVPQSFVYDVFEALERDAVIYKDEDESKRCGDAVWRVSQTPGAVGGELPSIYVENLVMGDQNTFKNSTAVTRSIVKDSSKIVRDDYSNNHADKSKGVLAWLHEHYVAPLIVAVLVAGLIAWLNLS